MKYNENEILELHNLGLTDKEISEKLGYNSNLFAKKRARMGLIPNNPRKTIELTKEEKEILCGTLLGDSTIRYVHKDCIYPNLTFSHCIQQKEYFEYKTDKLKRLCSSSKEYNTSEKALSKNDTFLQFTGKNMKCLVELRNIFYPNNIKIIPMEYIFNNFTELSMYYLMMDDGSYDISNNSYIINLQCFSKDNLKEFVNFLYNILNLDFSIKSDNTLYLKHNSNSKMTEILIKYNECDTMNYKCHH